MSSMFRISIGFVNKSPKNPDILFVGGTVVDGDISNGAEGTVNIYNVEVQLHVLDVAFLEKCPANRIMFSVKRPTGAPELEKWVGADFVGSCGLAGGNP